VTKDTVITAAWVFASVLITLVACYQWAVWAYR
jgi:hypothetical protein